MSNASSEVLARAASRAGAYPFFLARVFQLYRDACGATTDAPLLERLGCSQENLNLLALCRRPAGDEEVGRLAVRFGANAEQLAAVIREVLATNPQPRADTLDGGSA